MGPPGEVAERVEQGVCEAGSFSRVVEQDDRRRLSLDVDWGGESADVRRVAQYEEGRHGDQRMLDPVKRSGQVLGRKLADSASEGDPHRVRFVDVWGEGERMNRHGAIGVDRLVPEERFRDPDSAGSQLIASTGSGLLAGEDVDLGRAQAVSMVVGLLLADLDETLLKIEAVDDVGLTAVNVDGTGERVAPDADRVHRLEQSIGARHPNRLSAQVVEGDDLVRTAQSAVDVAPRGRGEKALLAQLSGQSRLDRCEVRFRKR